MLNMNCNMMLYRVFPKIFKTAFPKNTSDKIHLLKGTYYNCFICLTGNYMTKPTFKPRERSEDLPLLSVLILLIHVSTFFHICPFCICLSPVPLTSQVLQLFF